MAEVPAALSGYDGSSLASDMWFDVQLIDCQQIAEDEEGHADRHFDYSDASVEQYVMVGEPSQVTVKEPKIVVGCTPYQIEQTLESIKDTQAILWLLAPTTSTLQKVLHRANVNGTKTVVKGLYAIPCFGLPPP